MRQAGARFAACPASSGAPPRPPLGVGGPFVQVSAPASTPTRTPLRTADHPATPWWSALRRGEMGVEAGEVVVVEKEEQWAGRGGC
jgi:hypothetical protein